MEIIFGFHWKCQSLSYVRWLLMTNISANMLSHSWIHTSIHQLLPLPSNIFALGRARSRATHVNTFVQLVRAENVFNSISIQRASSVSFDYLTKWLVSSSATITRTASPNPFKKKQKQKPKTAKKIRHRTYIQRPKSEEQCVFNSRNGDLARSDEIYDCRRIKFVARKSVNMTSTRNQIMTAQFRVYI